MFANQTNLTKQKGLCLKADVNGLCKSMKHVICRIPVSAEISWCFFWSRSMMLWSLHTENAELISRGIIFDVLLQRHWHILSILRHLRY